MTHKNGFCVSQEILTIRGLRREGKHTKIDKEREKKKTSAGLNVFLLRRAKI